MVAGLLGPHGKVGSMILMVIVIGSSCFFLCKRVANTQSQSAVRPSNGGWIICQEQYCHHMTTQSSWEYCNLLIMYSICIYVAGCSGLNQATIVKWP
jgi:hypothetical protein